MMHKLKEPMYSHVKLSVRADLHDKKGTFSFSMIHQVTKVNINIIDNKLTIGLNFTSPNKGNLN